MILRLLNLCEIKKKTTKKDSKKEEKKSDDSSGKLNDDELWDDGMKIPDWLKTDSDK